MKKPTVMSGFTYFAILTRFDNNQNIWCPYRLPIESHTYLLPPNFFSVLRPGSTFFKKLDLI